MQLLACLALLAATPASDAPPALAPTERAWMQDSLASWRGVQRELELAGDELPWIVFFDERNAWHANAPDEDLLAIAGGDRPTTRATLAYGDGAVPVAGFAHGGEVALPGGGAIPARLILFASRFGETKRPFFVMAMPSIWRAAPQHAQDDPRDLELLIRAVFVHEISHTRQTATLGARIDEIVAAQGLGDDFDDDVVQTRFAATPGFAEQVDRERELLFGAADAADAAERLRLADAALASIRERRAHYFADELAYFAELEDIFLNMEGVANWAGFRALVALGVPRADAIARMRRGGRYWSQDEGLALVLAIDALSPAWKRRVFSERPGPIVDVLAEAIEAARTASR